jgi:hypothetical protein
MYAWHVRRQQRRWVATLALSLAALFGALILVGFVGGLIGMAVHYLS